MKVNEIFCKSLLNKSKIPGVDYAINPYLGCSNACIYCYAAFICKYSNHKKDKWGEFVDVKINAPTILAKELRKAKKGKILLSSVTDPYQALEKKHELTRKILQQLLKYQFPVSILTKNALALRDKDLFERFKEFDVGFTINFFDDEDRKYFEPSSSSIEERFNALNELRELKTYGFFGPIIPFVSDKNLKEFLQQFKDSGVNEILVDKLNIKSGNWKNIEPVLKKQYSKKFDEIKQAVFLKSDYYENLKKELKKIAKKINLNLQFVF